MTELTDSAVSYNLEGYILSLDYAGRGTSQGHTIVNYTFTNPQGETIFSGSDFRVPPIHSCDGIEAAASLLSFLTLRSGDTDSEYFDDYTPAQIEFRDSNAENLSMYVYEIEERLREGDEDTRDELTAEFLVA
jgi:hypothetical protein